MELTTIWIWLLVYGGVVFYFANKGRSLQLDAQAANETFSIKDYVKNEIVDIVLAIGIAAYMLLGYTIEGITVDFTTIGACFSSGILIAYYGVNVVLRLISVLTGYNLGNSSRRSNRKIIDSKTNELVELQEKKK